MFRTRSRQCHRALSNKITTSWIKVVCKVKGSDRADLDLVMLKDRVIAAFSECGKSKQSATTFPDECQLVKKPSLCHV